MGNTSISTFYNSYAPTNGANDKIKDAFYNQMQHELDKTPIHDKKIFMGDLNAKVGTEKAGYERTMEKMDVEQWMKR